MNFSRFFRQEDDLAEVLQEAQEIVAWARCPYHQKFLQYLDHEAWKSLENSGDRDITIAAVRAKAIRAIRSHITKIARMAEDALEEAKRK